MFTTQSKVNFIIYKSSTYSTTFPTIIFLCWNSFFSWETSKLYTLRELIPGIIHF